MYIMKDRVKHSTRLQSSRFRFSQVSFLSNAIESSDGSFDGHVSALCDEWRTALAEHRFGAALITAGANGFYYDDDQSPPFHANPHFTRWVPYAHCEHAVLLLTPSGKPRLFFYQPSDFWHLPPQVPEWAATAFELELHDDLETVSSAVVAALKPLEDVALVGPSSDTSSNFGLRAANPKPLVDHLAFMRAFKTPFEIAQMQRATEIGVAGHIAARKAFYDGATEFEIHMAYLAASGQTESELPYGNIIAFNEHAGTLHYQHYQRTKPQPVRSFLIDAGGRYGGFNSDITRTYSARPGDDFDALIQALDDKQRGLVASIAPGANYADLHERMHRDVAELLVQFSLVSCSAESAFEEGITEAFFPHGLGHLLGTQTHDIGGQLANTRGDIAPPNERYPSLRLTRAVEANQVFTVEPGLYFIPMLLDGLRDRADMNWPAIDALLPFGGIRIEDNILVTENGHRNLTRPVFAQMEADS